MVDESLMRSRLVSDAVHAFRAGVEAVRPTGLVARALRYDAGTDALHVYGDKFSLRGRRVWIAGGGKAAAGMALAIHDVLRTRVAGGVLSVPLGAGACVRERVIPLRALEGAADNLPDEDSQLAASAVAELAAGLGADDVLLVALSGGGSACLSLPPPGVSVAEKRSLVQRLARAGADIVQLNSVRKRLSRLKGGRLAALAAPAEVVALVLSDIVGDPLHLIASGPTVRDEDVLDRAEQILQEFGLTDLPESISRALSADATVDFPEDRVKNYIVGSNATAVCAATERARELGYAAWALTSRVTGEVREVARQYELLFEYLVEVRAGRLSPERAHADLSALDLLQGCDAQSLASLIHDTLRAPKVVAVLGGEPTVVVTGSGRGGRSQQLALEVSLRLERWRGEARVALLCGGTDGADGPTPAAGAVGTWFAARAAREAGLDPERARADNDAFNLFSRLEDGALLLRTGHTGTNVMDVHILMVHFTSPAPA